MIMNSSFFLAVLVFFSTISSHSTLAFSCHTCSTQRKCPDARFEPIHVMPPCRFRSVTPPKLSSGSSSNEGTENIRYLGSGEDAIIRPGVVLVAPVHEYDHFLMKSAVFVYAIGLDESENTIIRGVVLDHPTAFSIGEMSPNVMGRVSDNSLFRGGYDGSDTAMLLHSAGGPDGPVAADTMIGTSEIFEGGIVSAMESVDAGVIEPEQCKFFFNHMQFTVKELDDMFSATDSDGDQWSSLEIPPEYVLDSDYDRGELWLKLRRTIKHETRKSS